MTTPGVPQWFLDCLTTEADGWGWDGIPTIIGTLDPVVVKQQWGFNVAVRCHVQDANAIDLQRNEQGVWEVPNARLLQP